MAKKVKKTNVKIRKAQKHEVEQKVDRSARILQFVALVIAAVLLIIDAFLKDYELPVWVIGGIIGIAIGLSPDQIFKLVKEAILAFIGKKK